MGLALGNPNTRHPYTDYLTWPEDARHELIDGHCLRDGTGAAAHSPGAPGCKIYRDAANALDGKPCRPFIAPFDVRLPHANEADGEVATIVQPDLVVVCERCKLDERGCRGAPDIYELKDTLDVGILPEVIIDWERALQNVG